MYLLLLALMVLVKMGLSATSAKVRMYLNNPRYAKNQDKLKKILKRQKEKLQKREEILGKEANQVIQDMNEDKGGATEDSSKGSNFLPNMNSADSSIDINTMREKLLE